ncbi:hypothetical protein G6F50_014956 [Rhizopus delemar]|uniref:Uncharacterized protein n=1 Tax=Rhizopus delemar TaxID=936053 RepID=A0A9P7C654_9FUNG|nr:hypothetical protein G6F50_014956 [Rhizopus delemar]
MPFVTAVQADQDVGAGLGPDVGGAALRAAVEAVLQLAGRGVDGDRVRRFHFIADGLWQRRGVQREAAGQGRDVHCAPPTGVEVKRSAGVMPPSPVPGTKAACVLPPGVCHVGRRSPPPVPAHASGPPARGVTRCAVVEPAAVAAAAPAQRSQQAQGNPLGLWSGPGGDRRGLRLDRPRQRTGRTQPGQLPARQRPGRQPGHARG